MSGLIDSMFPEGEGGDQRGRLAGPAGLTEFLNEAFPLMAEDLRLARLGLGISLECAADRSELDLPVYRALEEGIAARNRENVGVIIVAFQALGLDVVRMSYVDEIQTYMKIDLSTEGPLVCFVDSLRLNARNLKEEGVFISPYHVLCLVEDMDFFRTFESNKISDKHLMELWVGAVYTLALGVGDAYYVRLAGTDPPDVEVLIVDRSNRRMSDLMLEVTRHGRYSPGLFGVLGGKLNKKYEDGTVVVVLVEKAEEVPIVELDEFIRGNNPHNLSVVMIGGSDTPGMYKVIPLDEVDSSRPSEIGWREVRVDARNASDGYLRYAGVVFKLPGSRFVRPHPVFVKELELDKES